MVGCFCGCMSSDLSNNNPLPKNIDYHCGCGGGFILTHIINEWASPLFTTFKNDHDRKKISSHQGFQLLVLWSDLQKKVDKAFSIFKVIQQAATWERWFTISSLFSWLMEIIHHMKLHSVSCLHFRLVTTRWIDTTVNVTLCIFRLCLSCKTKYIICPSQNFDAKYTVIFVFFYIFLTRDFQTYTQDDLCIFQISHGGNK